MTEKKLSDGRERLRLAIQKSGRLSEGSISLLERCGLKLHYGRNRLLGRIDVLPIDILLVRDDDIVGFVEQGICDIGIVGRDIYKEQIFSGKIVRKLNILRSLGFGKCRLSLAALSGEGVERLKSKDRGVTRIATSYPATVINCLKNYGELELISMKGAVELAPRLGIADAIVDLISTGASLKANGLEEIETILESEAVLLSLNNEKQNKLSWVLDKLLCRIDGVIEAQDNKYIMLHIAEDKVKFLSQAVPGAESPTVLKISGVEGIVAVHLVCREDVFWETMESLRDLGASKILVLPIEKMLI